MSTIDAAPAAPSTATDDPTIWEVDDALWADLQPLLVIAKPRKKPGRPRSDDRRIFTGLIWLARTGAQWQQLPRHFGPKSTAHDRLQEWVAHGCLAAAWAVLLSRYDEEIGLQWAWQAADGCIVKAPLGHRGNLATPRRRAATRPTAARPAASVTC
jgi:putative transposase